MFLVTYAIISPDIWRKKNIHTLTATDCGQQAHSGNVKNLQYSTVDSDMTTGVDCNLDGVVKDHHEQRDARNGQQLLQTSSSLCVCLSVCVY